MPTDPPFAVLQWLIDHPWAVWVWMGSTALAAAMRATWNVTEERPRWCVFVLTLLDIGQLNLSGPLKLLSTVAKKPGA